MPWIPLKKISNFLSFYKSIFSHFIFLLERVKQCVSCRVTCDTRVVINLSKILGPKTYCIGYLIFGALPFLIQIFDNGEVGGGSGGGCAKLPLLVPNRLSTNRHHTYRNSQSPPSIAKRYFV